MQYQFILNTLSTPVVFLTIGFLIFVLFSKSNSIIKFLTFISAIYVNLLLFCGEELQAYLGSNLQVLSAACFTFAGLALIFSIFKFIKASVNIVSWLMIALVAGSVAFPGIVKEKFPEKSHVNPIVKNYLSDEKVAFMMDYFKTGFFSKSLE